MRSNGLVLIASTLALAACGDRAAQPAADNETAEAAPATSGVTREAVEPEPAPAPPPAPAAIQTQPGPEGAQVALNRVAVTGDILTVALSFSGGECCSYLPIEEVSVIDDATSQRIGVLKDNAGQWMAAPLYNGKEVRVEGSKTSPSQVWFKFPAPPATSKTVSITIPKVAPFDAVPVAR